MYTLEIFISTGVEESDFHGISIDNEPICEYLIENGILRYLRS
jgi:hypothetical protein